MVYPYSIFFGNSDTEEHLHAYLCAWTVNHASQRLAGLDLAVSQVMEFGLSMDGPPATWFKTQPLTTFTTFDSLAACIKKLFQRRVPLKQLRIAYYLAVQADGEHITVNYMRF